MRVIDANGSMSRFPKSRFDAALASFRRRLAADDLPFLRMCQDRAAMMRVDSVASGFSDGLDDVVVLGIGGSALGTRALRDALLGPGWNSVSHAERGGLPKLHVVDNPDPDTIGPLLGRIDPARTVFNVVSKSGGTVETLALYLVTRTAVTAELGAEEAVSRFVFTTDAETGALRDTARKEGIITLPVPAAVGGRFSALSPVGLFPLALTGVDIAALLDGASAMAKRCECANPVDNPPASLAAFLHDADTRQGRGVQILMPYGDRLASCARFFQQLWAESLGKATDRGPTPVTASGPADQHSLLQLLVDGPRDKAVIFLESGSTGRDLDIPGWHDGLTGSPDIPEAVAGLPGHTLAGLMSLERKATAEALAQIGCPNATVSLPATDARSLGEFVVFVQVATVMAAALYDVDPFGQPGVEGVKRLVAKHLKSGSPLLAD